MCLGSCYRVAGMVSVEESHSGKGSTFSKLLVCFPLVLESGWTVQDAQQNAVVLNTRLSSWGKGAALAPAITFSSQPTIERGKGRGRGPFL